MSPVYAYCRCYSLEVGSINSYLRRSLEIGNLMSTEFMEECEIPNCEWVGWGLTKGVTNSAKNISVVNFPSKKDMSRGLHARLVENFPDLDPYPLCYDEDRHDKGFGGFIRWVYFSDPAAINDVLGIDFSIISRPTSGIANSIYSAAEVIKTLCSQGLSKNIQVALLNPKMCEAGAVKAMRINAGLFFVEDWLELSEDLFGKRGKFCPRCGLETMVPGCKFCYACGCDPELIRNGGN